MKKNNVTKTLNKGIVTNTPYIRFFLLDNISGAAQKEAQIAFIVSKKVHTSAVKRHRYQRWMREIVISQKEIIPKTTMLVLMAKPNIIEVKSLKQLQNSFCSANSLQAGFWEGLFNKQP